MKDPANKLILSGNAAGLDRIAHPIEGRRSRLPVAKQAPPRQFPTDSGKDIDTAQISKVFEGRFTEWSCQSLFLPSALTLWVPNLPLYQLIRTLPAFLGKLHLLPFLLFLCHLLWFLPQRFVVHNGLFARFWTRAKVESSGLPDSSPLLVLVMS